MKITRKLLTEKQGLLTFEWILLFSLLVIGSIAGMAILRDSCSTELVEVAQGIRQLDSTYKLPSVVVDSSIPETGGGRFVAGKWVPSHKEYTRSSTAAGSHHNDTPSGSHDRLVQMEAVNP